MDDCGGVHIHFPSEGSGSDKVTIRGPAGEVEKAKKQLLQLAEEKVSGEGRSEGMILQDILEEVGAKISLFFFLASQQLHS